MLGMRMLQLAVIIREALCIVVVLVVVVLPAKAVVAPLKTGLCMRQKHVYVYKIYPSFLLDKHCLISKVA